MENLQILVISASESRKQILEKQFSDLQIRCPIKYLEAKFLDIDANQYIQYESMNLIDRRTILSTKSHIKAVELAGLDESPNFTLIVEDDIAIHKTAFTKTLTEILENYDSIVSPHSNMLSLGWIPCNNYSFYEELDDKIRINNNYKILLRFTPGTQAYLIKKSIAKQFTPLFKHDDYASLRNTIIGQKNPLVHSELQLKVFDDFGSKLLNQCVLFPPIVIEQENISLIRDTKENPYWKKFFTNYEEVRKQFWSF